MAMELKDYANLAVPVVLGFIGFGIYLTDTHNVSNQSAKDTMELRTELREIRTKLDFLPGQAERIAGIDRRIQDMQNWMTELYPRLRILEAATTSNRVEIEALSKRLEGDKRQGRP